MMTVKTNYFVASTLFSVMLLSGCVTGGGGTAAGLLKTTDSIMRNSTPGFGLTVKTNPAEIQIGQDLRVEISSAKAGYLYVYQIGTDGKLLAQVLPNANDPFNEIQAGLTKLPRSSWRLVAMGPPGPGYVLAVVTSQMQEKSHLDQTLADRSPSFKGPYGAALVSYLEVPQPGATAASGPSIEKK